MSSIDVLYLKADGQGWGPVDELAHLCARLLPARLTTLTDRGEVSVLRKLASELPRRRGCRDLLVLAASPGLLGYAARLRHWLPGYRRTAAWVIDSFWTDRISRFARGNGHFDHVFITDRELIDHWRDVTRSEVHWAPWGTDTLLVPAEPRIREVDLLRLGRQPQAWSSDERTREVAAAHGLRFAGRPAFDPDPLLNQRAVRSALLSTKFVLAFSNLVSPAEYTHPTRDYLTGRWTDALGAGAVVAGCAPTSAPDTLWPGATVEIDPSDLDRGMAQVAELVRGWTSARAEETAAQARAQLDWRYRIRDIADALELGECPVLDTELASLAERRRTV